ncbi:hypothetical protein NDU88_000983 [Pleurodeles waltl]|uniref:Uncharacterized protein n=1 Tax=Pleurodeles waltl TaxID=8319 RepID=A0AAV7RBI0_PLEWA|nr:hypothetical protein NDU88_000983 [Pleurodeles waltl]
MAPDRGQGKRGGTASQKSRRHPQTLERLTGKGALDGLATQHRSAEDWRGTPTHSTRIHSMGARGTKHPAS